jgi:hypothetical protein
MATFYAVGENSKFYKSIDSGENWSVSILPVAGTYAGVYFIDQNIGWVCGYKPASIKNAQPIILKTIDGGLNWVQQTTPTITFPVDGSKYELLDILFTDANTGYCAGNIERDYNTGSIGSVLKTTDGGTTWNEIQITDSFGFSSFITIRQLVLDTDGGILLFSNISPSYGGGGYDIYILLFKLNGIAQSLLNNGIYGTLNLAPYQVSLINNKLRLANATGYIGRSTDDGVTITESLIDGTTNCRAIAFTNDDIGHIGTENGRMFRFNNSLTQIEQTYPGNSILWMKMLNSDLGIAVGGIGEIYKYQL